MVMDEALLDYLVLIGDPTPAFMLDRYDGMLATLTDRVENKDGDAPAAPEHLRWMIAQMRVPMEPLQASRWLGWVQAGVCFLGLTTSMAERDFTRAHFKPMRERWAELEIWPKA